MVEVGEEEVVEGDSRITTSSLQQTHHLFPTQIIMLIKTFITLRTIQIFINQLLNSQYLTIKHSNHIYNIPNILRVAFPNLEQQIYCNRPI